VSQEDGLIQAKGGVPGAPSFFQRDVECENRGMTKDQKSKGKGPKNSISEVNSKSNAVSVAGGEI